MKLLSLAAALLLAPGAFADVRFDFEDGTLQGFEMIDGRYGDTLSDRKNFYHCETPCNKQGKYFITTIGEGTTGTYMGEMVSPVFIPEDGIMTLMVGGGADARVGVLLCSFDDHRILARANGKDIQDFQNIAWNLPETAGKRVYLKILDRHPGSWGYVAMDNFFCKGRLDPEATKRLVPLAKAHLLKESLGSLDLPGLEKTLAAWARENPDGIAALQEKYRIIKGKPLTSGLVEELQAFKKQVLFANPVLTRSPILFVTRQQYQADHHNTHDFFPSAQHEFNMGSFTPGGALKILDASTGKVRTLLATATGVIRDPDVHFDAKKIVFSMRRDLGDSYHLYEINVDGTGLTQLTTLKDADDLDPLYLPDGHIVFSSTREPKYCLCNRHIMANLYSMEADGANIIQISKNPLFDNKPSLMPDGRILYTRWEYVDREQLSAQGLWVCNPDGTRHQIIWGNNTQSPGGVLDGRAIPGATQQIVCTFSACHDRPWGAIAIINRALGLDGPKPVVAIWPAGARQWITEVGSCDLFASCNPKYEDPFPLGGGKAGAAGRYFLCARTIGKGEKTAIALLDADGGEVIVHEEADGLGCFDPMPVEPRKRPPEIASQRVRKASREGLFYISDVYNGTHMEGIKKGDVKRLRIVETPEKRFFTTRHLWTAPAMNWHEFNAKQILGTVPIEADGSAYFRCPAEKFVYFQLLDENGMMIQSMRSGTFLQPGEIQGCIGCHDDRLSTPKATQVQTLAMKKEPAMLKGWYGKTEGFNYLATIQPILDKHCISCHDYGKPGSKKIVLAGDKSVPFNVSYMELQKKGYTGCLGAGPVPIRQPKTWGSHASALVGLLRKGHHDVRLDKEEMDKLVTWIDLNGPYYPTYGCAFPENLTGRCPLNDQEVIELQKLSRISHLAQAMHTWASSCPPPWLNFDRPHLSPLLQSVPDNQKEAAIAILKTGSARMKETPRADMPGFKLNSLDAWREEKYQSRCQRETLSRQAIQNGEKYYDRDWQEAK
jgi:hypothetical protein